MAILGPKILDVRGTSFQRKRLRLMASRVDRDCPRGRFLSPSEMLKKVINSFQ